MKSAARHTECLTKPPNRPGPSVLRHKAKLHTDSLAKQAAGSFRMSRSAFSFVTSRRSRSISNYPGFIWPWPGNACNRMGGAFLDPAAQHVLTHVQIAAGLDHRNPTLLNQPDSFSFEFPAKQSPSHLRPPFSLKDLNQVSVKPAAAH